MPSKRLAAPMRGALCLLLGFLATVGQASGQAVPAPPSRIEATRPELEALAAHPPKGMSAADRASVQSRLANGDFAPGDKVNIVVQGEASYTGTFIVVSGRSLVLPSLPPLSLEGVLRSEADSVVSEFLGKYIRNPQVTVTPLVRLGVLGGVAHPGYYDVPSQSLLSEVIMGAGGVGANSRMDKTVVYRGNDEVLNSKAVNMAIADGNTLDVLNLQSGDNIQVGIERASGALTKVQLITGLLAIPIMIFTITALAN